MTNDIQRLGKLLKAQKLVKMRDEANLENSRGLRQSLDSSRRCDVIDEKLQQAKDIEQRKDMAAMLEEYVAAKIIKDTSLA